MVFHIRLQITEVNCYFFQKISGKIISSVLSRKNLRHTSSYMEAEEKKVSLLEGKFGDLHFNIEVKEYIGNYSAIIK